MKSEDNKNRIRNQENAASLNTSTCCSVFTNQQFTSLHQTHTHTMQFDRGLNMVLHILNTVTHNLVLM